MFTGYEQVAKDLDSELKLSEEMQHTLKIQTNITGKDVKKMFGSMENKITGKLMKSLESEDTYIDKIKMETINF